MRRRQGLGGIAAAGAAAWFALARVTVAADTRRFPLVRTDTEWRGRITPAQCDILHRERTETPGFSPLDHEARPGRYACVGCDQPLFSSATKFDSHTGWPSFRQPFPGAVATAEDRSLFMARTGVACANCGGHLGHVFDDGPKPTDLRYCMNAAALSFHPAAA